MTGAGYQHKLIQASLLERKGELIYAYIMQDSNTWLLNGIWEILCKATLPQSHCMHATYFHSFSGILRDKISNLEI